MWSNEAEVYAHTLGKDPQDWETLDHHAHAVARLATDYASAFGAGDWGGLLGMWHDLGKASADFQDYLRLSSDPDAAEEGTRPGRVDHSTFGARYAVARMADLRGQLLAFCIAGHHAGLGDATADDDTRRRSAVAHRLRSERYKIPLAGVPSTLAAYALTAGLRMPAGLSGARPLGFAVAFFGRMLFSALVDADRTATEAFGQPDQSRQRLVKRPTLAQLRTALDAFLQNKQSGVPPSPVNVLRGDVLAQCIAAGRRSAGFFSLNVPTGGGKTLASLAFALHHAAAHPSLRRVVVAIPFTSIIEQTADVYRDALHPYATLGLVEHHSSLNPKTDTRQNKLAAETWDAPLVVTTNVQLFESLFAADGTHARKLHRLACSVIILDEAQSMPIDLLKPTLAALQELVARYGCTVVLCTATQPALQKREREFAIGIDSPDPIVADEAALHAALRRVDVSRIGKLSDDDLVSRLAGHRQVLCIVNTKAHAADLYNDLVKLNGRSKGCFHLSTLMCPQHRRDVLAQIKKRLAAGKSCRVVSTQLIEAGVDIDLPAVYRAQAGFDSIAQAAGRCNREGKLRDDNGNFVRGQVFVFESDRLPPPGLLRQAAAAAAELSPLHPDPLSPSAVEAYFRHLYWLRSHEWDTHHVMDCFEYDPRNAAHGKFAPLKFATAADAYQLIRDEQTPVLVPYNAEAKAMIDHVVAGKPIDRAFFRNAQKYTVSVRDQFLENLASNGVLMQHEAGLWALLNPDAYSSAIGLIPNVAGMSPEMLNV